MHTKVAVYENRLMQTSKAGCSSCIHERATEGVPLFFDLMEIFWIDSIFPRESLHILFLSFLWKVIFLDIRLESGYFFNFNDFLPTYSIFTIQNLSILYSYFFDIRYMFLDIRLESGYFFDFIEYFSKYSICPSRISPYFVVIFPIFGIYSSISD